MKTVGIVTKYNDNCIFCGRPTTEEHHLLFGNGFRKLAEEDGIKVPVCEYCHTKSPVAQRVHDNTTAEKLSKIAGQLAWESLVWHPVTQKMKPENFLERGTDAVIYRLKHLTVENCSAVKRKHHEDFIIYHEF